MWVKDGRRLTENFFAYEFQCKGEQHKGFNCCNGSMFISSVLVNNLQKLRHRIGRAIHINSGCRCRRYNLAGFFKSSETSSHIRGVAVDLAIPKGMTYNEFLAVIKQTGLFSRIGLYDTFIHVDIDPNKPAGEWDNRTEVT